MSEARRSTRVDCGGQLSAPTDAKKACRLLPAMCVGRKERWVAEGLVGLSGVRAGGLAVKGQFPRNGRCASGSVELLGTRAWASSLREADAGALPGLALSLIHI